MAPDEVLLSRPRVAPQFVDMLPAAVHPRAELSEALLEPRAYIPPKFFYDPLGSRLFEAICELPEYPLTRTERAILDAHLHEIAAQVEPDSVLVDLGAGNCEKAERLFEWLSPAQYVPVDIAADFLRERLEVLAERHPHVPMLGIAQDFTQAIRLPAGVARGPRVLFYPGSSIGNFSREQAAAFLRRARAACGDSGYLLLGADLVKDARTLELAYDDSLGVTAAFNLNVLRNVNSLLGSDFDVSGWQHVALYDSANARIEMHLQARAECTVQWLGHSRTFNAGERIHTENSHKYTLDGLQRMLLDAGFTSVKCYTDTACTFAVALAAV